MSDAKKPYLEDIFPNLDQLQKPAKPYLEDIFPPKFMTDGHPLDGPTFDEYFGDQVSQSGGARIVDGFDQGFKQGWGTEPLGLQGELKKLLKPEEYEGPLADVLKAFHYSVVRPLAIGIDFATRLPYATGLGLAGTPTALRFLGAGIAAGMEAFPAAHLTGLPVPGHIPAERLTRGADLGTTKERAPGITPHEAPPSQDTRLSRSPEETPTNEVVAPPAPEPVRDVHSIAREQSPITMERYDTLQDQETELRRQLDFQTDTRNNDPRAVAAQNEIDTILGKVNNVESRLTKKAAGRLGEIRADLDTFLKTPTEEMLETRRMLLQNDEAQRDLAPAVTKAYQDARKLLPPEEVPEAVVNPAATELAPEAETAPAPITPNVAGGFDIETQDLGTLHAATREQAERLSAQYGTLTQRRPTILQTVTNQFVDAGRPLDEARAIGAIASSYYRTRAARFNGALGSARDLFDREQPAVRGGDVYTTPRGQERPEVAGAYNVASNTIEIFKSANAGTGVHEFAHTWFEQLLEDGRHPQAPDDLKADVDAVKAWLQIEGDRPSRKQHELFARGFERYLREGVAPTPQLAGVFAKFKQWLTQLYRTATDLRVPINDSMRSVYDHLLAKAPEETIIASDRDIGKDFADVHANDAAATAPEGALEAANRIRGERDEVAQLLRPEINNERRRVREEGPTSGGGDGATGPTGDVVLPPDTEGKGPQPGGDTTGSTPVEIVPSGAKFKTKSEPPSGPHESFTRESRVTDGDGRPILDNIESPDDVDAAIRESAEAGVKRGPATDGQLIDLADSTGIPASQFPRNIGFDAGQIDALAKLAVEASTDVHDKMVMVAEGGDPLELAVAIARLEMIQGKAVDAADRWGKAGAALRAFKSTTGTAATDALSKLLKENSGRSYDDLLQLARAHTALTTPSQIGSAIHQTHNKVVRGIVYTIINGFLSNPFTHTVYHIGNDLRNVLHVAETGVEGVVGSARSALRIDFGTQDRVYMEEAGAALFGMIRGTKLAGRPAIDSFRAGQQMPLPGQKSFSNPWGGSYASPFPESVNNVIGFPGKSVAAIHQFNRVIFYEQHIQRLATRAALDEGLNGDAFAKRVNDLMKNPPDEMIRAAADEADTDMFQRRGGFNSLTRAIEGFTEKYALAKILFPFVKIGMEITREYAVKRTPVGVFSQEVRDSLLGRRGGAAFDAAAGKQMAGLAYIAGGVGLAMSGEVTGPGPEDPGARSTWLLSHQPYSVRVGNLWVPYRGLGPQAKVLEVAVDVTETVNHWDGKDGEKLAGSIMKALAKSTLDESFFRSSTSLTEAMLDPAHKGVQFLENAASGLLPFSSAIGSTNRMFIDPFTKEIEPGYAGFVDALRSRIPVASWNVNNKVDAFGRDIPSRGIVGDRYAGDATVAWLNSLGVGPGRMDRVNAGVRLTETQFNEMERIAGTESKKMLDIARPSLQSLPKGLQIKEVNRLLGLARGMARQQLKMEYLGTSDDIVEKANELKRQALE